MTLGNSSCLALSLALAALPLSAGSALAQSASVGAPESLLPADTAPAPKPAVAKPAVAKPAVARPAPVAAPSSQPEMVISNVAPVSAQAEPAATPSPATPATPPVAAKPAAPQYPAVAPLDEPVQHWTLADAQVLLAFIADLGNEGLFPADYEPTALGAAIVHGEGPALDAQASRSFAFAAEDLRDGRTRMDSRLQWFAVDHDVDLHPVSALMTEALAAHDVAGVLGGLAPTNPDYAALKAALAATPKADKATRNLIRINMDRWRWLPKDMGKYYLLTNIPEFQLRLTVDNSIIRSYRTIVGKPGRTATPQLAETVQAVVFNPTWTVPQSIVKGEGLGARLYSSPRSAAAQGYKVTKSKDGVYTVVQQPGDNNSLGRMKIDMPNPHAIYLHDTPHKALFNEPVRDFSHGCVRTERAVELGMTMAILGAGITPEQAVQYNLSGKYTRVPMTKTFPVYLTYLTMATDIDGQLHKFGDIYGRDAPVLASFAAPREPWNGQRQSKEAVIKLDNPL